MEFINHVLSLILLTTLHLEHVDVLSTKKSLSLNVNVGLQKSGKIVGHTLKIQDKMVSCLKKK